MRLWVVFGKQISEPYPIDTHTVQPWTQGGVRSILANRAVFDAVNEFIWLWCRMFSRVWAMCARWYKNACFATTTIDGTKEAWRTTKRPWWVNGQKVSDLPGQSHKLGGSISPRSGGRMLTPLIVWLIFYPFRGNDELICSMKRKLDSMIGIQFSFNEIKS